MFSAGIPVIAAQGTIVISQKTEIGGAAGRAGVEMAKMTSSSSIASDCQIAKCLCTVMFMDNMCTSF